MLNVRSTCLFLGLSLAGLSAAAPMSAKQTIPAPAEPTSSGVYGCVLPLNQGGARRGPRLLPLQLRLGRSARLTSRVQFVRVLQLEHRTPGSQDERALQLQHNRQTRSVLTWPRLLLSHTADPVGFEFDLIYGDTANQIAAATFSAEGNPNLLPSATSSFFDKNVEQAFVSFKPAKAKGFEIDFGKFVTSAGAEVIES